MTDYHHSAHAVQDITYHLVWSTKYRHRILRGEVAERARDMLRRSRRRERSGSSGGGVAGPHPQVGRGSAIGGSTCGARGNFCATVGAAVDARAVLAYIESQRWEEDADEFKVTAPTEP